jgi:hypothetical protein
MKRGERSIINLRDVTWGRGLNNGNVKTNAMNLTDVFIKSIMVKAFRDVTDIFNQKLISGIGQ